MPSRTKKEDIMEEEDEREDEVEEEDEDEEEEEKPPRRGGRSRGGTPVKAKKEVLIQPKATPLEQSSRRVLIAEGNLLRSSCGPELIVLPHPKSREGATFLVDKDDESIAEVMHFNEDNRCWFIDSEVEPAGSAFVASAFDPVFLLVPYLRKMGRLEPIQQAVVEDTKFPNMRRVAASKAFTKNLNKVAISKGSADLNVWQWDETKALDYFSSKVKRVYGSLLDDEINIDGGATSSNYVKSLKQAVDEAKYLRYAFGIVSEYLEDDLAAKLKQHMEIPEEEPEVKKAVVKRESSDAGASPKRKKAKADEGPEEDYSVEYKKSKAAKEAPALNAKQKALAKSASGSKNIASFFTKK